MAKDTTRVAKVIVTKAVFNRIKKTLNEDDDFGYIDLTDKRVMQMIEDALQAFVDSDTLLEDIWYADE